MEILILGLARGSVYALVAVGFVLVFSVGGILNLAHGTLFMLGAYFTYICLNYAFVAAGTVALLASIALSVVTVAVLALLLYLNRVPPQHRIDFLRVPRCCSSSPTSSRR